MYPEGMICYFLYWSIQFPFMFISPQKIWWLFLAKAVIVPPTWLALLIWAFVKVPPNSRLLAQKAEISSSDLSWAWLGALNSVLGLVLVGHYFVWHIRVLSYWIIVF